MRLFSVLHDDWAALTASRRSRGLGDENKVKAFLTALEPYGIKEIAQSGLIAMGRGSKSITERVFKA